MQKRIAIAALMLPALSHAAPVVTPPGSLMSIGAVAGPQSGLSVIYNPAAAEMALAADDKFRWGYLASMGLSVELGAVDNFADDVEQLIDDLDAENVTADDGDRVINDYNNNLRQKLGDEGYLKIDAQIASPLSPLLVRSNILGGVISLDLMAGASAKLSVLDDEIRLNDFTNTFETNTAVYLKTVQRTTIGLGYGREINNRFLSNITGEGNGRLLAGVRANFHNLKLSKQVIGLLNIDEDDELADVISDEFDKNQVNSSAVGLDLGLIWEADNYHVGLAWRNINEPEFDYGDLGGNCLAKETSLGVDNCFTALYFAGQNRISLNETHVMTGQSTIDAAINTENKRWRLAASYDLQSIRDPLGDEYQWASASAAYVTTWLVGGRVGITKNLVGSELTMANVGLTLLGVVNLDLRYSLDSIEIDGSSAPRAFGINLGFESSF